MKATSAKQAEKKRIAQPLAPEIIARIIELKDQGKSDRAVAEELKISIPPVSKHYKRALATRAAESQPTSEAEEPTPTTYPPVGVVPPRRRSEVRTDFSQPADELTDVARALQARQTIEQLATPRESALDVALKLDELERRKREPTEAALDAQGHEISQLKHLLAQAQVAQVQAQSQLQIAEVNASVKLMQSEMHNEMEKLKIELSKGNPRLEELRFWFQESPELVKKMANEFGLSQGQVRQQLQMMLHLMGARVGGMVSANGEGFQIPPPVEKRVVTVGDQKVMQFVPAGGIHPGPHAVEPTDADFEAAVREMEEEAEEDHPSRDLKREARLARELAQARKENAELQAKLSQLGPRQPEIPIQPTTSRRVLVAGTKSEEAV